MPSPLSSIIRSSTRAERGPYNILTFVSHERYESTLCKTGSNFFSINQVPYTKGSWNDQFAKVPDNYTVFNSIDSLPIDIDIDFVLCHNKYGLLDMSAQLLS
mgnify:CR=1 FL=1